MLNPARISSTFRAQLKQKLSEYIVPSAYVLLEELPLTANGKVDRRSLPAPEGDTVIRGAYVAPRTPAEGVLCGLWSEVLGVERVGVHDGFFELGGHSLLAMRLLARMRQVFGVEFPLRMLFEAMTVAACRATIENFVVQDVLDMNGREVTSAPWESLRIAEKQELSMTAMSLTSSNDWRLKWLDLQTKGYLCLPGFLSESDLAVLRKDYSSTKHHFGNGDYDVKATSP